MNYCTGKLPPKLDERAPKMARLYSGDLPVAPPMVDWLTPLKASPMFLNQELGCCTVAAAANRLRVLTANVWGDEYVLPDDVIRSTYLGLTGGADDGLYETDLLSSLSVKGLGLPGRQYRDIPSWATVDHTNGNELRLGIAWFGGIMGGFNLPNGVEQKFDAGIPWDAPAGWQPGDVLTGDDAPGAGGGHEMYGAAYVSDGIVFLTWGGRILVTNRFLAAYLEECQVCVSRLWLETAGAAPDGLDLDHLEACMASIREGTA